MVRDSQKLLELFCVFIRMQRKDGTRHPARTGLALACPVASPYAVLRKPPYQLLEGEYVRCEARVISAAGAGGGGGGEAHQVSTP
jgi:hypothetical protein